MSSVATSIAPNSEEVSRRTTIKQPPILLMALCLILALAYLGWNFAGMQGSDDLAYARYANQIIRGQFTNPNHSWAARVGIVFPLSVMYRLVGISELSNAIVPTALVMLCFFVLAWFSWQQIAQKTVVWVLPFLLLAATPTLVKFSTQAVGHAPAMALTAGAHLLIISATRNQYWKFITAGLLIGLAYLMHEVAILGAVSAFIVLLFRLRKREVGWFSLAVLILGVALIPFVESASYWALLGKPLHRFTLTETNPLNDAARGTWDIIRRILYLRWVTVLTSPDLGIVTITAGAIVIAKWRSIVQQRIGQLLLVWLLASMFVLTFFSTSLRFYNPIHLYPEFHLPILPPLFLLAILALAKAEFPSSNTSPLSLLLALPPIYTFASGNRSFGLAFSIVIPVLVYVAFKYGRRGEVRWCLLLAPLLVSATLFSFHSPGGSMLQAERQFLASRQVHSLPDPVWTDERSSGVIEFLTGFAPPFEIRSLDALDATTQNGTMLVNWKWLNVLKSTYGKPVPSAVITPNPAWCLVDDHTPLFQIWRLDCS